MNTRQHCLSPQLLFYTPTGRFDSFTGKKLVNPRSYNSAASENGKKGVNISCPARGGS